MEQQTPNYRIEYRVVEGSGRLYVQRGTTPIRKSSAVSTLSTSNAASVRLDMNGTTNKIRATAAGAAPATVIFIFGYPDVEITGGNGQEGVFGGQLKDPLVVRVTDGKGRAISGLAAAFTKATTPTTGGSAKFIPVSGTSVYITSAGALAATYAAATGASHNRSDRHSLLTLQNDAILVQTDSRMAWQKSTINLSNECHTGNIPCSYCDCRYGFTGHSPQHCLGATASSGTT